MNQFPEGFLNNISKANGFSEIDFIRAHHEASPTSIRLNPAKLVQLNFQLAQHVPWCDNGYYLDSRPSFTLDPLFHAGCYYVQEASSMFISYVLKQIFTSTDDLKFFDVCASPGGKTTILSEFLNNKGIILANEFVKGRSEILKYNLAKWGNCNHIITNNDTEVFNGMSGVFDLVLVDAPCSGSGLFRKQEDSTGEWSLDNVHMCQLRQKEILANVIDSVKTDGYLIYTTCSYSPEEDESIAHWLLDKELFEEVVLPVNSSWGIVRSEFGYRFYPDKLKGEGFYCSVFRRKSESSPDKTFRKGKKTKLDHLKVSKSESEVISRFVNGGDEIQIISHQTGFKLISMDALNFLDNNLSGLYFRGVGTEIGEIKNGELVPDHELALSNFVSNKVEKMELSDSQSVAFLKKEIFDYSRGNLGIKLMCNKGYGIGWGKELNNRINNYLPGSVMIKNKSLE